MRSKDDLLVLHPGRGPRRRDRRRGRRRLHAVAVTVMCVAALAVVLPFWRPLPERSPGREPAFPPEAFTTAPAPPATPTSPTPAWDAGSPQAHPRTLPSPIRPAQVAAPTDAGRECDVDDLSIVNHGWDAWTGNTATSLTATNLGDDPCLLGGWPSLRLDQGGRPLALTTEQVTHALGGQPVPPRRLLLRPGQSATTLLTWRGYRNAADSETPQRLTIRLGSVERREVPLEPPSPGPAPFDLVDGGALLIGAWQPANPGE